MIAFTDYAIASYEGGENRKPKIACCWVAYKKGNCS